MNICSNGNLQFGATADAQYLNDAPPSSATPNNAIYPCWDDLYFGQGGIYYQTDGTAPNRTFTVAWINRQKWSYPTDSSLNFEAILYEGSNNVEFRYGAMLADTGGENGPCGSDYTIGVENNSGTAAH